MTDSGWGAMCPGCYTVVLANDTGLRPSITLQDLLFLRGWEPAEIVTTAEGEDMVVNWLCDVCSDV
jgi:hypothetical protein